mgnify:CR=1 FL=1
MNQTFMRIKVPNIKDLLKPTQVYAEYGIKPRCLAYMREQTKDTGQLVGPLWIQQGNIVFYKRKWIEEWIANQTFVPAIQTLQNKQKNANIHKFQKPTT